MGKKTSQWSKDVRNAANNREMTLKEVADHIGYSAATVYSLVNGRYSNQTYKEIAKKINDFLGTEGFPERTETPSPEWCRAVKIELLGDEQKQKPPMSVSQLAEKLNVSRDRLSLVINGKMMNEEIVAAVNSLLNITVPAIPSGND